MSNPQVELHIKDQGVITLELDQDKAPKTVENFLQYVKDKQYDGTVFHRVIDGFMIQGGGFTPDMKQKPTRAPIPLEAKNGLKNDKYTIAMARTSDPNSATAHENLGDVYVRLAAQSYSRAKQLEPGNTTVPPKLALIRQMFSAPNAGDLPPAPADGRKPVRR